MAAHRHSFPKRLNFWFSDLFSLEPIDNNLRPLRVNNRFWKTDEYKEGEVSSMFKYMKPRLLELIESINFKQISRDINMSGMN